MMDARPFLPYGRQRIEEDDVAAVVEVLRGDWLTTGPRVAAFEAALAERTGAAHAVACANGTAALHLAALALDLGEGDSVIVPAITFLATANAARFVGAEVVFADVDPENGLMRAQDLEAALARPEAASARAVFPVHLAGQCCDMEAIGAIARDRGLAVVEDACHAIGSRYRTAGGASGPIGDGRFAAMATFSFHPMKTVTMGEGGAVTTNDAALAERLRRLRNHGMTREPADFENADLAFDADGEANPWYYEMPELGFNYRASDLHCALGLSQLGKFDRFAERRRALARRYDELLAPLAPRVRPASRVPRCEPVWHFYAVLVDYAAAGVPRGALMRGLRAAGIGSQVHYLPLHLQPYYRRRYGPLSLPGAEAYYAAALSLPLHPGMADEDMARVVDALSGLLI